MPFGSGVVTSLTSFPIVMFASATGNVGSVSVVSVTFVGSASAKVSVFAVEPKSELGDWLDAAGGTGRPRYGQVPVCYGPDEAHCRKLAHEQWRWGGLGWPVNAELPEPRSFDAATAKTREEDVAELVPCGPDLDRHVRAVRAYLDAGFTHVALVQVGGDEQDEFLRFAERELLPALRAR